MVKSYSNRSKTWQNSFPELVSAFAARNSWCTPINLSNIFNFMSKIMIFHLWKFSVLSRKWPTSIVNNGLSALKPSKTDSTPNLTLYGRFAAHLEQNKIEKIEILSEINHDMYVKKYWNAHISRYRGLTFFSNGALETNFQNRS